MLLEPAEGTSLPVASLFFVQVVCADCPARAQGEGVEIEFARGKGDEDRCAEEEAERGVVLEGAVGGGEVGWLGWGLGLWLRHGFAFHEVRRGGEEE